MKKFCYCRPLRKGVQVASRYTMIAGIITIAVSIAGLCTIARDVEVASITYHQLLDGLYGALIGIMVIWILAGGSLTRALKQNNPRLALVWFPATGLAMLGKMASFIIAIYFLVLNLDPGLLSHFIVMLVFSVIMGISSTYYMICVASFYKNGFKEYDAEETTDYPQQPHPNGVPTVGYNNEMLNKY